MHTAGIERWQRLADYCAAYGGVAAVVAVILVAFRIAGYPITEASGPVSPAQLVPPPGVVFTCVTGEFSLSNANETLAVAGRTRFCENPAGDNAELNLTGTDNCLTYAGPRDGGGTVDAVRCADRVSQQWDLYASGMLKNAYTGNGLCLDGSDGRTLMVRCSRRNGALLWSVRG